MPTAPELEAAISAEPDDLELRRVYADALQEIGDARGEHIALSFLAAAGDADAAKKVRAAERAASERLRKRLDAEYVVRLTWSLGFVTHVDIDSRGEASRFPRAKLRELLEERELIAVRGLDLRGIWSADWSAERQLGLLPALVEGRPIRWLGIGDGGIRGEHITQLRTALPRLTGLGVLTTKPRSAAPALRGLVDVELAARETKSTKLLALAFESLSPELERLVLHGMDDRITADAFKPMLQREVFPKLRHLGVFGPLGFSWDLLRALLGSPLLSVLDTLGFSAYEIHDDDESETWFKQNASAFARVRLFTSAQWPDEEDDGSESSNLGILLNKVDRPAEGIAEIEHHLQFSGRAEDHFGCWKELAGSLVRAGWPDEAIAPLDTAIRLFRNKVEYDSLDTFKGKIEALDALGNWEAARELCVRVIAHDSDDAWGHRFHGRALRELGRDDDALEALSLAVKAAQYEDDDDPTAGLAHVELGHTLWQMRRYDSAIATLAKGRLRGARNAKLQGWWSEGRLRWQRGDLERARTCLERAAELVGPNDLKSPLYELGEVLYELGRHEEALAVWKRGAAMFAEWVDVEEQGHALLALGRLDEALVTVETARKNSGVARALILHALGRTTEALGMVDDLAHRPGMRERSRKRGKPETVCAARHAAGSLLEGAFHRAAGREDVAREKLERIVLDAYDPRQLHALLVAELGGAPGCDPDSCGRPAAVAALAGALALGDQTGAQHRAAALGAAIDRGSARLLTMRLWDVRGALPLLGGDPSLATRAALAVERCNTDALR